MTITNRLKSAVENVGATETWKQTFTFDRFGNRRFDVSNNNTTTLLANCPTTVCNPEINPQNNRLVGSGFDNAGNTTQDADGNQFIYDGENKQIVVKNGSGATLGIYYYDGDGKRIKKISAQETVIFVYSSSGQLIAEYANQIASSPQVSYTTSDHLGSPRIVSDANGQITSRRDFMPYGEEIYSSQRTQGLGYGADSIRKKFTGYERDVETNLDYAQARMYASQLGRFTSIDQGAFTPADPQNWNRYIYVQNNPLKFVDPTGNNIELSGAEAQNFVDWLEKNSGLKLKYKTKNGVITITGSSKNKSFTGSVNEKFVEAVKKAASANETAKFNVGSNMTGQEGSDVFVDDNGDAWNARFTNGNNGDLRVSNLDMADLQSLDKQAPELGLALVGHTLVEGVEMRKPGGNFEDTGGDCGAHCVGLKTEAGILSAATNVKQETRFQPEVSSPSGRVTTDTPFSFVYTTVQYDISLKNGVTVNKISPPTVQRPKKNK